MSKPPPFTPEEEEILKIRKRANTQLSMVNDDHWKDFEESDSSEEDIESVGKSEDTSLIRVFTSFKTHFKDFFSIYALGGILFVGLIYVLAIFFFDNFSFNGIAGATRTMTTTILQPGVLYASPFLLSKSDYANNTYAKNVGMDPLTRSININVHRIRGSSSVTVLEGLILSESGRLLATTGPQYLKFVDEKLESSQVKDETIFNFLNSIYSNTEASDFLNTKVFRQLVDRPSRTTWTSSDRSAEESGNPPLRDHVCPLSAVFQRQRSRESSFERVGEDACGGNFNSNPELTRRHLHLAINALASIDENYMHQGEGLIRNVGQSNSDSLKGLSDVDWLKPQNMEIEDETGDKWYDRHYNKQKKDTGFVQLNWFEKGWKETTNFIKSSFKKISNRYRTWKSSQLLGSVSRGDYTATLRMDRMGIDGIIDPDEYFVLRRRKNNAATKSSSKAATDLSQSEQGKRSDVFIEQYPDLDWTEGSFGTWMSNTQPRTVFPIRLDFPELSKIRVPEGSFFLALRTSEPLEVWTDSGMTWDVKHPSNDYNLVSPDLHLPPLSPDRLRPRIGTVVLDFSKTQRTRRVRDALIAAILHSLQDTRRSDLELELCLETFRAMRNHLLEIIKKGGVLSSHSKENGKDGENEGNKNNHFKMAADRIRTALKNHDELDSSSKSNTTPIQSMAQSLLKTVAFVFENRDELYSNLGPGVCNQSAASSYKNAKKDIPEHLMEKKSTFFSMESEKSIPFDYTLENKARSCLKNVIGEVSLEALLYSDVSVKDRDMQDSNFDFNSFTANNVNGADSPSLTSDPTQTSARASTSASSHMSNEFISMSRLSRIFLCDSSSVLADSNGSSQLKLKSSTSNVEQEEEETISLSTQGEGVIEKSLRDHLGLPKLVEYNSLMKAINDSPDGYTKNPIRDHTDGFSRSPSLRTQEFVELTLSDPISQITLPGSDLPTADALKRESILKERACYLSVEDGERSSLMMEVSKLFDIHLSLFKMCDDEPSTSGQLVRPLGVHNGLMPTGSSRTQIKASEIEAVAGALSISLIFDYDVSPWPLTTVWALCAFTLGMIVWGIPPEVALMGLLVIYTACGYVHFDTAFIGFGDVTVVAQSASFVLSHVIEQSGFIEFIGNYVLGTPTSEFFAVLRTCIIAIFLSACFTNTVVVAVLAPVAVRWAARLGVAPSRYLMPLAFASCLAGCISLVATPPSIILAPYLAATSATWTELFSVAFPTVIMCCLVASLTAGRLLRSSLSIWKLRRRRGLSSVVNDEDHHQQGSSGSFMHSTGNQTSSETEENFKSDVYKRLQNAHQQDSSAWGGGLGGKEGRQLRHDGFHIGGDGRVQRLEEFEFSEAVHEMDYDEYDDYNMKSNFYDNELHGNYKHRGRDPYADEDYGSGYNNNSNIHIRNSTAHHQHERSKLRKRSNKSVEYDSDVVGLSFTDSRVVDNHTRGPTLLNATAHQQRLLLHKTPRLHMEYHLLFTITGDSPLVKKSISESHIMRLTGVRLLAVASPSGDCLYPPRPFNPETAQQVLKEIKLEVGTCVKVAAFASSVPLLRSIRGFELSMQPFLALLGGKRRARSLVELAVHEESVLIKSPLDASQLLSDMALVVIGVRRVGVEGPPIIESDYNGFQLIPGDVILVETNTKLIVSYATMFSLMRFVPNSAPPRRGRPADYARTWLCVVGLLAISITCNIMPELSCRLAYFYFVLVLFLLWSRAFNTQQMYASLNISVLLTIGASFGIAQAFKNCGTTQVIAKVITSAAVFGGPFGVYSALFLFASILGSLLSGNAAAVLIAGMLSELSALGSIQLDQAVILTLVASNCCFLMPFGSHVSLMVLQQSRYEFRDFFRFGLPIQLVAMISCVCAMVVWG